MRLGILWVAVFALVFVVRAAEAQKAQEPSEWHSATEFTLEGRGWKETESPYDRFPPKAHGKVPENVWGLSQMSAGIAVRFQSDAPRIWARWSLTTDIMALPHMPATGVSGVDLYTRQDNDKWVFVGNGRPLKVENNIAQFYPPSKTGEMREYLLYLPLYNGTKSLELGVVKGHRIQNVLQRPQDKAQPIVYYGSSIAQGGCASRPGMAFTNILGRTLDRPVINLGFSGSAMLEQEVADIIAELDPILFVLDALPNAHNLPPDKLTARLTAFAKTLRAKHPDTPILFVGQASVFTDRLPLPASKLQEVLVETLRQEGIKRLYLLDGANLFGADGEGTVDGAHPNDLGMVAHAKGLQGILERIIRTRQRD
ncbi:MAG: SGNH/GDSL hydrolase family protein [Armatimonadetes bacterium]|nr:SGNH/GDSL hydrolase family protein [Armatimonadota bacterium]